MLIARTVHAGLLSARTSSAASGEAEGGTGRRLEKLVRGGAVGPIAEALATYAQDYENIKWVLPCPIHRASGLLRSKFSLATPLEIDQSASPCLRVLLWDCSPISHSQGRH